MHRRTRLESAALLRFALLRLTLLAVLSVTLLSCEKRESGKPQPSPQDVGQAQEKRPNILLIVADDLGWSDLGAWGGEIPTPAIDKLAITGLMLTNFHTASTCSPSRAMLLTGRDNHRVGLGSMAELLTENQRGQPGYEGFLVSSIPTLAEQLLPAGYHTYMAGKWHLGGAAGQLPADRGFEQSFALLDAGSSHFSDRGLTPMDAKAHYVSNAQASGVPETFYSSDYYTDRLIGFIDQHAADRKPFFAYAAFTAPHYPLQAPQEWVQRFADQYHGGWDELRAARWQKMQSLGLLPDDAELPPRHPLVPAWDSLPEEARQMQARSMAVYAAMIANLDWNIGRLLSYLEQSGVRDNTVVIFISDNGAEGVDYSMMPGFNSWFVENFDHRLSAIGSESSYVFEGPGWAQVSNLPFSHYKGVVSEGGTRVPAIINVPGNVHPGSRSNAVTSIRDVYPTVLELAGVADPAQGKGVERSLLSLLVDSEGALRGPDDYVGMELLGHQAVISGHWKAVRLLPPWGDGQWQLFDLIADPVEQVPLQGEHPDKLDELVHQYSAYAVDNGVVDPPAGSMRYPVLPPLESWQSN